MPFPRPRSSSDSCIEAASNRLGIQSHSSAIATPESAHKGKRDSGLYSDENSESFSPIEQPSIKDTPNSKNDSSNDASSSLQANAGSLCFSGTLDSNSASKISHSSYFSSTTSSTSNKSQSSISSCLSCCSRMSAEVSGDKKSPVIHVKLYSSGSSEDSSESGGTSVKRHSHVLCHKVPLSSLTCCSECRTEKDGDVAPCNCVCTDHYDSDSLSDRKSVNSSIQTNSTCSCAEEVSCTCTKGSQITCEVDLVFEGENVKNVPMKNEIMEVDISNLCN